MSTVSSEVDSVMVAKAQSAAEPSKDHPRPYAYRRTEAKIVLTNMLPALTRVAELLQHELKYGKELAIRQAHIYMPAEMHVRQAMRYCKELDEILKSLRYENEWASFPDNEGSSDKKSVLGFLRMRRPPTVVPKVQVETIKTRLLSEKAIADIAKAVSILEPVLPYTGASRSLIELQYQFEEVSTNSKQLKALLVDA